MARATFGVRAAGDWALRPLQQRQGLGGAVQLDQGVGAAQQQLRIVGVQALQGLGVQALGLGVLAQARGGGGQAGAVGHGRRVVDGLVGLAILALRVEDLRAACRAFWALAPPRNSGAMMASR
jgi:hypothetical protein